MSNAKGAPSPLTKGTVEATLRAFFATDHPEIAAAYLFGSVARGQPHRESDVDIALLFEAPPPRTLEGIPAELEVELTRLLGARAEVVVLNRAPVDLVHRVLRDGILVAEGNRSRRVEFEVRARNHYWDLLPILRRYRKMERKSA